MNRPAIHPSRSSYQAGCRCAECKAANTRAMRERRAAERADGWAYRHGRRSRPSSNPSGARRIHDRAEIARVAADAYRQGRSMIAAVAELTGGTKGTAVRLMWQARHDGYPVPRRGDPR